MNETVSALEEKVHRAIPVSAAMHFRIEELSRSHITVNAPLEPNVNIHGTAFAGSIYSVAALSAWALLTHVLTERGLDAELVIARGDIKYRAPVKGIIHCECQLSNNQLQTFVDELVKKNGARIEAEVNVGKLPEACLHVTLFASRKDS